MGRELVENFGRDQNRVLWMVFIVVFLKKVGAGNMEREREREMGGRQSMKERDGHANWKLELGPLIDLCGEMMVFS